MPPKRPGRFKRAVKATGRGIAKGARAVVKGVKILAKRQLTKKEIEWANKPAGHEIRKLISKRFIENEEEQRYGMQETWQVRNYYMVGDNIVVKDRIIIDDPYPQHAFSGGLQKSVTRTYTSNGKLKTVNQESSSPERSPQKSKIKTYEPPGSFRYKKKTIERH